MQWAWMASLAFLFGAELDAELDDRGERPLEVRTGPR